MLDYVYLHSGDIASVLMIIAAIGGMIFWSHHNLHADIMEIREDAKRAHSRIDSTLARIDAMGARIDAMGTRIDGLYTIMMKSLEERK